MVTEVYAFVVVPVSLLVLATLVLLFLFEPSVAYRIEHPSLAPREASFGELLATLCGSAQKPACGVEVLSRGETFYESELAAIRNATRSIHLEAYIFHEGRVAKRFVDALTERARAGVEVRLVLDAFGNLFTRRKYFRALCEAGGQVAFYQPLRWYTLKRYNNRTHREILVIDGDVAFVGGAGIADWWIGEKKKPPWRDTVVRFHGALVPALQAIFAENWLGASGEILFRERDFGAALAPGIGEHETSAPLGFLVPSTPSEARVTRARLLLQTLVASARKSIRIQTPYFVPDRSARRELVRAAERGVDVDIVVVGAWNNHKVTRLASRARYGALLRAGVKIREYAPSMNHTKTFVIDEHVSVVGSSNWDNRSASLNDEVNLVLSSDAVAARLLEDFAKDASESQLVTFESWRRRGLLERLAGPIASLLGRQA
jgi:cardiolipin synthase